MRGQVRLGGARLTGLAGVGLAGELGVRTIVTMSGTPGDGSGASTVDWIFYPWPDDALALSLLAVQAPDEATRQRILVDNPAALFGF